eukprot:TRINITY_DN12428_c1_g1_i1.p1 TRINITY_DN12428_c1_g1~~TRINITY_DN12428_c1_g1_i1.p1  ORF type:complete len:169 (+),score=12.35 TRINITY_DN12428_c1_g1_i1:98-604(+)
MAHLTKNPENPARWAVLYPVYLDSNRTVKEGRRLSKDKAVENPTNKEIYTVLIKLKQANEVEIAFEPNKFYSRNRLLAGRFRFQLKKADGSPTIASLPTRKAWFEHIAKEIKAIEDRVPEPKLELLILYPDTKGKPPAPKAASASPAAAKPAKSGKKDKGKKGKKKKK